MCLCVGQTGGLHHILTALDGFPEVAAVQEAGCEALRNLCLQGDCQAKVMKAGGLARIYNTMHAFPATASVLTAAVGALRNLCASVEASAEVIASGGLARVMSVCDRGLWDSGLAEVICEFATNMCRDIANCTRAVALGVLPRLVTLVESYADVAGVQEAACPALRNCAICVGGPALLAAGALTPLYNMLQRHAGHENIEMGACLVLGAMALHPDCALAILTSGGLRLVLAVLPRHDWEGNVCHIADSAAKCLGVYDVPEAVKVELGGTDWVNGTVDGPLLSPLKRRRC